MPTLHPLELSTSHWAPSDFTIPNLQPLASNFYNIASSPSPTLTPQIYSPYLPQPPLAILAPHIHALTALSIPSIPNRGKIHKFRISTLVQVSHAIPPLENPRYYTNPQNSKIAAKMVKMAKNMNGPWCMRPNLKVERPYLRG